MCHMGHNTGSVHGTRYWYVTQCWFSTWNTVLVRDMVLVQYMGHGTGT